MLNTHSLWHIEDQSDTEFLHRIASLEPKKNFVPIENVVSARDCFSKNNPVVATLIFAGGQGSRLGVSCSKALVTLPNGSTLIEQLIRKCTGPVFVMCSKGNYDEITEYLQNEEFFGKKVFPFVQKSYPFFDLSKKAHQVNGTLAFAPGGNGEALLTLWEKEFFGIDFEHLSVCPIDNPLWDPEDRGWIAYHLNAGNEVSIAACPMSAERKMGVIGKVQGRVAIQEYLVDSLGWPSSWGNIGSYLLTRDFCEKAALYSKELPLYPIEKTYPDGTKGYKLESFFFDLFSQSKKAGVVGFDAQESFLPIKEKKDLTTLPFC